MVKSTLSVICVWVFMLISANLIAQTSLDTAVIFTIKDVDGVTHRLDEYLSQQKIVVIDFFTITCGPCTTYAPLISESYNHFGCNSSNVVFLGINWGADNAGVINFGLTYNVHYPEISGTEGNGNHVVADYGVLSYPTVILILPNYSIAEKYIWPPTTEHLDSIVSAYGGVQSVCYTPVSKYNKSNSNNNKILSVNPQPASTSIVCTTSVNSRSNFEVCSLSGEILLKHVVVSPGESVPINIQGLPQGFYLLVLRNNSGMVLDRKPFVVGRP
jgi:thiol-disulfide isomerase/thioredoxin